MSQHVRRATRARMPACVLAAAALVAVMSGCSVVQTVNKVRHDVDSNRSTIKTFTSGLKSAETTPFQATYTTTGSEPTTITYAAQPPKDAAFRQTSSDSSGGTSHLDLVSNAAGEYSCSSSGTSATWSCTKLSKPEAIAQNQIVGLYTPSHWITFLDGLSTAAGFAGIKVTTSTMTVNGFSLNCVDFRGKHIGDSTICTTQQDVLGYVKVAHNPTSFEIKSYTNSPPASAFRLPAGAKITKSG
jgi:hypothetical protein